MAHFVNNSVPVVIKPPQPVPYCLDIVLSQRLDVYDLEPGALRSCDELADLLEFALWEHVPAHEASSVDVDALVRRASQGVY